MNQKTKQMKLGKMKKANKNLNKEEKRKLQKVEEKRKESQLKKNILLKYMIKMAK